MQNKKLKKMILAALFAAINIAVSSVAFITNFVPFQHATNVVGAVFLGPTYNLAQAFISGTVRMFILVDLYSLHRRCLRCCAICYFI